MTRRLLNPRWRYRMRNGILAQQMKIPVFETASPDTRIGAYAPSPWKRWLVTAVRWSLLVDALVSASAALLTIFPWPVWTPAMGAEAWPVGMVVPEIALWLVPLPVCFAAAALWLGRRSRRWLTGITVVLCAAAVMLLCKPAVQAWWLGRHAGRDTGRGIRGAAGAAAVSAVFAGRRRCAAQSRRRSRSRRCSMPTGWRWTSTALRQPRAARRDRA